MTGILGIFGWPVSHTLSPLMHNTAIRLCGIDFVYVPFEVSPERLKTAVDGVRGLGICGINVTIPHKESIISYLDDLDCEAKRIGAVNTICLRNGKLVGYNTDGAGFIDSLTKEAGSSPAGKTILVFGAGGAARGIALSLALKGAKKIIIVNRNFKRGKALETYLKDKMGETICIEAVPLSDLQRASMGSADILINTTSVGMKGNNSVLFDYDMISKHHIVYDIVYTPIKTMLLKAAEEKGAKTVNGLGMLIHQGARSFKLWTGREMPIKEIEDVLYNKLKEEEYG